MRTRRLRGAWSSHFLQYPARKGSGSCLSPGTHTGFSNLVLYSTNYKLRAKFGGNLGYQRHIPSKNAYGKLHASTSICLTLQNFTITNIKTAWLSCQSTKHIGLSILSSTAVLHLLFPNHVGARYAILSKYQKKRTVKR